MDKKNQYMEVTYRLTVNGDNGPELMEEATADQPFTFITGFGYALDYFEEQIIGLEKGATFEFSIPKEQAYGDYNDTLLVDVDREVFTINGHFDHENVKVDAVLPLQNEEGQRFYGRVVEVGEEKVKIDLNHPLAGEDLYFQGAVIENREATAKEIEHLMHHIAGGCSCGGCHGDHDGCDHEGCHHDHGGCSCGGCN